jgi:succinate dehydrogenase/fumarate reductase flavoprotein subunit
VDDSAVTTRTTYDIVVVGAGTAGLTAAIEAAESGARVLLLEKLQEAGGTLPVTSGKLWHSDPLRDEIHGADPRIVGMVSQDFDAALDWLRERGIRMEIGARGFFFIQPDPVEGALMPLLRRFEDAGGKLMLGTAVDSLIRSPEGDVCGVRLRSSAIEISAKAVIIATGGFQLDPELVTRYIAPWESMFARANRGTTGDGFRMATAVGVGTTAGLASFYGHLSPPPPARIEPSIYRRTQAIFVPHVVLLNLAGKRFVDESRPQVVAAEALAKQECGLGVLIFDSAVHQEYVTQVNPLPEDSRDALVLWRKIGARIEEADTLDSLLEKLYDMGLAVGAAKRTLQEYDAAAVEGSDRDLSVQRRKNLHRCFKPPFYAVPVHSDITFTEGGLRVDESCQALDVDGAPVPGLYVVGEAAGLVSNASQAGGLATGLVTGLRAARHSMRRVQARIER